MTGKFIESDHINYNIITVSIKYSDIKRIVNNIQTSAQVLETDILANLPNDKKNWLVNYLDQVYFNL